MGWKLFSFWIMFYLINTFKIDVSWVFSSVPYLYKKRIILALEDSPCFRNIFVGYLEKCSIYQNFNYLKFHYFKFYHYFYSRFYFYKRAWLLLQLSNKMISYVYKLPMKIMALNQSAGYRTGSFVGFDWFASSWFEPE